MIHEPAPELEYVSEAEWQTARRWLALLRELANKQDRTRADVAAAAAATFLVEFLMALCTTWALSRLKWSNATRRALP